MKILISQITTAECTHISRLQSTSDYDSIMVNTQQTSTTVATASVGMVLYEHIEDSKELFL